jgi:hypothetical protein
MEKIKCQSCGRELPPGSLKYVVEVKSFADFDGYLEEYEGDIDEGISELLDAMENIDADTLEEDISKELVYILCKRCAGPCAAHRQAMPPSRQDALCTNLTDSR